VLAAARSVLGPSVKLVGASRTDAGVHAMRQVASLTTDNTLDAAIIGRALNATLPRDVRVLRSVEADAGFDARRSATGKRYAYVIDAGLVADPLLRRVAWHVSTPLDLDAMRAALRTVLGAHHFGAFCAAAGRDAIPLCRIRAIHIVRRKLRVVIVIAADRFLHHMVRNLVGSAVLVGRGSRAPTWLGDVLTSRDRRRAGPTAPAHGLFLVRVLY